MHVNAALEKIRCMKYMHVSYEQHQNVPIAVCSKATRSLLTYCKGEEQDDVQYVTSKNARKIISIAGS